MDAFGPTSGCVGLSEQSWFNKTHGLLCTHTLSLGCDTLHCKLCTSKTLRGKRVSGFVKSLETPLR